MTVTRITNVVVPEVFNPYTIEKTAELSALVQSGIVETSPELNKLAASGGKLINMPFWQDLTGDDEVLSDTSPLTAGNITAAQDVAVLLMRGRAWGANDLAKALAGDDPMRAVGDLVAAYWARRQQAILLKILEGIFGAASMAGNALDISGETGDAANITASTFIDAQALLGDAHEKLTAVMMHSATVASLAKLDLIDYIPDSQGKTTIKTFLGKRIVEDDDCPVSSTTYTTYLFGPGAVGYGEGGAPVPTETDRDSLQGDDILINRRHFILHPRGVKFTSSSVAGSSPTNAELATAANWLRVYEAKNVRIVQFKHKLHS